MWNESREPVKTVRNICKRGMVVDSYWGLNQSVFGTVTIYELYGKIHREDGPARIVKYDDGEFIEEYMINGSHHRYGGPAYIDFDGQHSYYIHGSLVDDLVLTWMAERDYEWETMNEQEKWELELFMRSLG